MHELSPEDKKALEDQKAQCPFCKIINGEIPSRKTFEDERTTAILDINPLVSGHTLLLTKEHYAILPLIPNDEFVHLFRIVKDYSFSAKRALLKPGATVFVANGYAAGQISPHFMIHILPRDKGDKAGIFNTEGKSKIDDKMHQALKRNLPIAMENHFKRHPEEWHQPREIKREYTREEALEIVENNKGLLDAIREKPADFIDQAKRHPQLKELFSNITPEELVSHFNPDFPPVSDVEEKAKGSDSVEDARSPEPDPETIDTGRGEVDDEPLSKEGVILMLKDNPKALEMIENDPEEFKKKVKDSPRLRKLFAHVDLDEIVSIMNDSSLERKL